MPKTRELTIKCDEVKSQSDGYRLRVVIDEPDINDLVSQLDWDDIVEFVRSESQNKPERVCDEEYLEKWAEENGYVKNTES